MANMSYCRFQNTMRDLRDCADNLHEDLNEEEQRARKRLIKICREIVGEADVNPEWEE